ncbi:MAG: hypothetical protein ABW321_20195 [Polyangiales bacterium]
MPSLRSGISSLPGQPRYVFFDSTGTKVHVLVNAPESAMVAASFVLVTLAL